jgi:putative FmdB family regulatory protein
MPIYEYACKKCGHLFSELVWGDEEVRCPACNSRRIERQISGFAVGGGGGFGGGSSCPPVSGL